MRSYTIRYPLDAVLVRLVAVVAVGVIVLVLLALGHSQAGTSQADATTEVEFSIAVAGCNTFGGGEVNKCNLSPGSSFTLDMSWDGFSGAHAGNTTNVQMLIHWTGAVSGPTFANGKALNITLTGGDGCEIAIPQLEPGNDPTRALLGCAVLFAPDIATGVMGTAQFNCGAGQGTIELEHGEFDTLATDPTLQPHWEDNATDTLTINCGVAPQDGAMAVDCDATQAGVQSDCTHAPGSSFQVEVHVTEPPTGGYFGFQAKLGWTEGVVNYLPTSSPPDEALWPECTIAARLNNWEDAGLPSMLFACVTFPQPPVGDTFIGAVLTFEFQCKSAPAALSPPAGLDPNQSALILISRQDDAAQLPDQGGTNFSDIDFQPIDPALTGATVTCAEPAPQGDVNCDNLVNVVDALFILQFEVGLRVDSGGCPLPSPPPDTLNAAGGDVNKDGFTNVVDALFILQCEVGLKPGANMPFCLQAP